MLEFVDKNSFKSSTEFMVEWLAVYSGASNSWFWQHYWTHQYRLEAAKGYNANKSIEDHSFIVKNNEENVGVVPLALTRRNNNFVLAYGDSCGLSLPFFARILEKHEINSIQQRIKDFCDEYEVQSAWWTQSGVSINCLELHQLFFQAFDVTYHPKMSAKYESNSINFAVKKRERKYHKLNLINFKFTVVDARNFNKAIAQEYRKLHQSVSEKKTRSDESYELQFKGVTASDDFILSAELSTAN